MRQAYNYGVNMVDKENSTQVHLWPKFQEHFFVSCAAYSFVCVTQRQSQNYANSNGILWSSKSIKDKFYIVLQSHCWHGRQYIRISILKTGNSIYGPYIVHLGKHSLCS